MVGNGRPLDELAIGRESGCVRQLEKVGWGSSCLRPARTALRKQGFIRAVASPIGCVPEPPSLVNCASPKGSQSTVAARVLD